MKKELLFLAAFLLQVLTLSADENKLTEGYWQIISNHGMAVNNLGAFENESTLYLENQDITDTDQAWQFIKVGENEYNIAKPDVHKSIDNNDTGNPLGNAVIQWSTTIGNPNQIWVVEHIEGDTYAIISKNTGMYLSYPAEGQARGYSKIGYVISDDGINFRRVTKMPVLIPEYPHEGFSVMNPYVIRDEERGVFRMWYASGETFEPNVLCYAESIDGIHWEKSPLNPIYVHGEGWEQDRVGGCEVHKMDDGRYALFYIGYSDILTAHIGVAFSEDGITGWERYEHNPIIVPEEGSWDAAACYKPTVYRDVKNNMWHLWYNGRTGGDEYIGYVTHEGLDITK